MKKILSILLSLISIVSYGQSINGPYGNFVSSGDYPNIWSQHTKGLERPVADTFERNAILPNFLQNGQFIYTRADSSMWKLDSTQSPVWVLQWKGKPNALTLQQVTANGNTTTLPIYTGGYLTNDGLFKSLNDSLYSGAKYIMLGTNASANIVIDSLNKLLNILNNGAININSGSSSPLNLSALTINLNGTNAINANNTMYFNNGTAFQDANGYTLLVPETIPRGNTLVLPVFNTRDTLAVQSQIRGAVGNLGLQTILNNNDSLTQDNSIYSQYHNYDFRGLERTHRSHVVYNQQIGYSTQYAHVVDGVLYFGDSITAGTGAANTSLSFINLLSAMIGALPYNGVQGNGISGSRLVQNYVGDSSMVDRIYEIPTYAGRGNLRGIVFEFTTNDVLQGKTSAQVRAAWTQVLDSAIARGWPVSLLTITGPTFCDSTQALGAYGIDTASKNVAAQFGVNFADVYNEMIINGGTNNVGYDSLHPNNKGHLLYATTINSVWPTYNVPGQNVYGNQLVYGNINTPDSVSALKLVVNNAEAISVYPQTSGQNGYITWYADSVKNTIRGQVGFLTNGNNIFTIRNYSSGGVIALGSNTTLNGTLSINSQNVIRANSGSYAELFNSTQSAYASWKALSFIKNGGTAAQFLMADGSSNSNTYATLANPTATIGLTAVNGTATSAIRSDGAPALSQAIIPTWTGLHTFTGGIKTSGNIAANNWTTTGINFATVAATYNDNSSSGTVAGGAINTFGIPTITSTNVATYNNAQTVYIAGAPVQSGNLTISAPWSFWVNSGNSYFAGDVRFSGNLLSTNASTPSGNIFSAAGGVLSSQATYATYLFRNGSTIRVRNGLGGNTTGSVSVGDNYANVVVANSPVGTAASGTNGLFANLVVKGIGTVQSGGASLTNTATLYLDSNKSNPSVTGLNYSIWDAGAIHRFDGIFNTNGTLLTSNQLFGANSAGTAMEGKTLVQGSNITITQAAGTITIAAANGSFIQNQTIPQTGSFNLINTSTNSTTGGQTGILGNTYTWSASTTPAAGSLYAANFYTNTENFNSSETIPNSAIITSDFSRLTLNSTASSTVTMTAGTSSPRAQSTRASQVYFPSVTGGVTTTISDVANMELKSAFQDAGTTNSVKATNYYQLLIDPATENLTTSTLTNVYDIYTASSTDLNQLTGNTTFGNKILQTNATAYSTGGFGDIVRNATTGNYETITSTITVISGSTATLALAGDYTFTGTTSTFTLPAYSSTFVGRKFAIRIMNEGVGTITLNSNAGGNDIYTTTAVATYAITPGTTATLIPDANGHFKL